jgi:2-iminobutanoate/2-iminopropanoate deaminase
VGKRSIEVAGLHHRGAPIPAAAHVRGLVMSSGIMGMDRSTGELADTLDDQVAHLFDNIERVVSAAGGTVGDIVKVTFFVTDRSTREAINVGWNRMFPDESDRPARHTLTYELPSPMLVQAEVVAMVGAA